MSERHYIVFMLGEEAYGIEATSIREISRTKEIQLNVVPKTPSYIKGIINLRGEIVPVMALKERFGLAKHQDMPSSRLIIVYVREVSIGLLTDTVVGNRVVDEHCHLQPTDEMKISSPHIKDIVKLEQLTFFVLDLEKLY